MGGFALLSNFACDTCGSPSIMLPGDICDSSSVCCSGCGVALGSWSDLKRQARQIIDAEVRTGQVSQRYASVDL